MGSISYAYNGPLPDFAHQRLEQAALLVSRCAQSSERSIGINWRRLGSSIISEHYHVEYPGLSNQQIAIQETLDEVIRKVVNRQLDLSRLDSSALQGTLEEILSDILDCMVHDAVASSSDNSDGGSGPDSSDEEDDDDDDGDGDNASDAAPERGSNGFQGHDSIQSDRYHRPNDSGSGSDSDSDSGPESGGVWRHQQHQHPHRQNHQYRHEAANDHYSRSSSQDSSYRHDVRRSRGGFITIKRRKGRIPSPTPSALTDQTPRGGVGPQAVASGPVSPGTAQNLPPSLPPSSSFGHASDDGLLQQRPTEEDLGTYDEYQETVISISQATPAFATLVSSVTNAEGPRRRGAAASLEAALGPISSHPEEAKANDGGSTCCSTM
ncbi:hypothetical protein CPB83DRAFT_859398 [Crepidotus variabilis]|uniref:Uncharacterized protein n=1 Tax=Crepidotus variabilis TaxID=179855 RepID=A0A9P6EA10_9AGAR|nr:hypothetical protein CPB83DRAFT_859398 [Crepidotus variabilis]